MKVLIKPYDTDMGVYWQVINKDTGDIFDDGFDSSADAEMFCFDKSLTFD